MGASDSKLVFKQGIFKLSEQKNIPGDDIYWTNFWQLPESAEDIFSLLSSADVRRIRDEALTNLETLILTLTSRLFALRRSGTFPNPDSAPENEALNCIRILTRVLPFIYEAEHLDAWEERFFWSTRRQRKRKPAGEVLFEGDGQQPLQDEHEWEETRPLAQELIDTLVDLLFFADFTLPSVASGADKVRYAIWQSGVGCNSSVGSTKEMESNRMEVLRLLLTLTSKSMYTSQGILPVQGIPAITYLTTLDDKKLVLTLLCSLLNTALKYHPATWHVPYDHVVFRDAKQAFVTNCLQLLLVLILYPVPEQASGPPPINKFRHFLGKLHRPQDFQFLLDGMTRVLNQPLQATSSYLPGSQRVVSWAPEMIMLFWELLQCNKRFRSFIIDTDRSHDFVILILFHAVTNRHDPSRQGTVRMCVFVLQSLSVEPAFGARLNKQFVGHDSLPVSLKLNNFRGSYADYLIISICNMLSAGKGSLEAVHPALLAIINNIAPYVTDLVSTTCGKLLQLFSAMSSTEYLFANESNHLQLTSLLEAFNAIIEKQHDKNAAFIYAVICSRKRFYALRDIVANGGEDVLMQFAQRRKELAEQESVNASRRTSTADSLRSPSAVRAPSLSNVPETSDTFTIGDDDDDGSEDDHPSHMRSSRTSLHSVTSASSSTHDETLPTQLRGMSEKARGKMPLSQPTFSRTNSATSLGSLSLNITPANGTFQASEAWLATWLSELPIATCITVIDRVYPHLPPQGPSSTSSPALAVIRNTPIQGLDVSPVRVHLFEWSPLSLGWYESLLWSFIFMSEMTASKGAPGVWRGTNIRLFRVQETAAMGPSLASPKGAVDAVGTNLMQRIGSLGLGGTAANGIGGNSAAVRSSQINQGGGGVRMRDV